MPPANSLAEPDSYDILFRPGSSVISVEKLGSLAKTQIVGSQPCGGTFEHSVVWLLKFVETDAVAEGINDIH
jgi:hypothetical protein